MRITLVTIQIALIVMDVFWGQMTAEVLDVLGVHIIYLYKFAANITYLFQPLYLTINNHCKVFMKNKFGKWFAKQVENSWKLGFKV